MKQAMLIGPVVLEVFESHVPIVMAISRRKLARTRAPTSIPSWSMKLIIVIPILPLFRRIRMQGYWFRLF